MSNRKRFSVPLSMDVYNWIKEKAKNNSRSMGGEINLLMKKAKEREESKKAV